MKMWLPSMEEETVSYKHPRQSIAKSAALELHIIVHAESREPLCQGCSAMFPFAKSTLNLMQAPQSILAGCPTGYLTKSDRYSTCRDRLALMILVP